jgi:hypothetical protein
MDTPLALITLSQGDQPSPVQLVWSVYSLAATEAIAAVHLPGLVRGRILIAQGKPAACKVVRGLWKLLTRMKEYDDLKKTGFCAIFFLDTLTM